jgi:hypothetical protein
MLVSDNDIGVYSYIFNSKVEADNNIFQTVTFDDLIGINKIKGMVKEKDMLCRQPVSKTPNSYGVCYTNDIVSIPSDPIRWLSFEMSDEQKSILSNYDKVVDNDYSNRRSTVILKQIAIEISRAVSIPVVLFVSFFTFVWIGRGFYSNEN